MIESILLRGRKLHQGTTVEVVITCEDTGGQAADPDTLAVEVQAQGQAAQTYTYGESAELTRTGVGAYLLTIVASRGGLYQVRSVSTGAVAVAEAGHFYVHASNIT